MPDNGQNVKRRTYILFPNGWRVLGRWYKLELRKTSIVLWTLALHQSLKTQMLLSPQTRPITILVFVHKSRYVDWLIKEFGIANSLGTLHIPRRYSRKWKSWIIIGLFYVPLEFKANMKNGIYRHSTKFLNYTSVLTNSVVIMLGLPNPPENLVLMLLKYILDHR
jgi:hypothetical protein